MSRESKKVADTIKAVLNEPLVKPPGDADWLSMGCAPLNLAVSDRAAGGIAKGLFLYIIGDSSSGKTWNALTVLAEACRNKNFDGHRIIFDNAENGSLMDMAKYFGKRLCARLTAPRTVKGRPAYSETIQDFYYNLDDARESGRPYIYVLDSMDALDDAAEAVKFRAEKVIARGNGKEKSAGSYGIGKASYNSRHAKRYAARLAETGSVLIVLSQTRDKINTPFPQKTHAGGHALKFYAHVQIWTRVKGHIKKTVNGKERIVGDYIEYDIPKNRITGEDSKIIVPFIKRYGFDDVGACVDLLVDECHWAETAGKITATEFSFKGSREKLIARIEAADSERELHLLCQKVWAEVREKSRLKRKPRYE